MKPTASTQENIPIAGVKDGIVILRNGQYRMIFEVSAVNFSLKSEDEQNSLVLQYQSFLNSIHFPIEITIRSKKLDLAPYINKIKQLNEKQTNELLKIQTTDYIDFVGQLINLANIMKKTFYVSLGYQPLTVGQGTVLDKLFNRKKTSVGSLKISDEEFNHNAKELRTRGQNVAQGLGSMGLHCKQLNTEEVIELFYGIYNPEVAGKERLTEAENVSSAFVTSEKPAKDQTNNTSAEPVKEATDETPTIDNRNIVQAQEKQKAQEKAFENQSQEQRSVGTTPAAKTSPVTPITNPTAQVDQNPKSQIVNLKQAQNQNIQAQNQPQQTTKTPAQPASNNQQTAEQKAVSDPDLNKNFGW